MRITIDTNLKTIEIEGSVNFDEMVKEVQKMLPDYKDYQIKQAVTVTWYPVTQPVIQPYIQPFYFQNPIITCGTNTTGYVNTLTTN